MSGNNLHWFIEYKDGTQISEFLNHYSDTSKENVKYIMLTDGANELGVNVENGIFFINNKKYDFKIGNGPFSPLQFKSSYVEIGSISNKTVYNVGLLEERGNIKIRYYFSVSDEVCFNAVKFENDIEIDRKKLHLGGI